MVVLVAHSPWAYYTIPFDSLWAYYHATVFWYILPYHATAPGHTAGAGISLGMPAGITQNLNSVTQQW